MTTLASICVYCGSSPGRIEAYASAARELADAMTAPSPLLDRFATYQAPQLRVWVGEDET